MENIDKLYDELEKYQNVLYRIKQEGFDYCFKNYSSWKEIEDETFHKLRQDYLDISNALVEYVNGKIMEIQDNIDEEQ